MPVERSVLEVISELKNQKKPKFNEPNWFEGKFSWNKYHAVFSLPKGYESSGKFELIS